MLGWIGPVDGTGHHKPHHKRHHSHHRHHHKDWTPGDSDFTKEKKESTNQEEGDWKIRGHMHHWGHKKHFHGHHHLFGGKHFYDEKLTPDGKHFCDGKHFHDGKHSHDEKLHLFGKHHFHKKFHGDGPETYHKHHGRHGHHGHRHHFHHHRHHSYEYHSEDTQDIKTGTEKYVGGVEQAPTKKPFDIDQSAKGKEAAKPSAPQHNSNDSKPQQSETSSKQLPDPATAAKI